MPPKSRGSAYIVALVLLSLFTAMSVSFSGMTDMNYRRSDNNRRVNDARLAAESGLSFVLLTAKTLRLGGDTTQANFADNLAAALGAKLNGTANLAGQTVSKTATSVTVPDITLDGRTFGCTFTWASAGVLRAQITGHSGEFTRKITMSFALTPKRPAVFDYGVASRGSISIGGSSIIRGVNSPAEASVLSVTTSTNQAISVSGSANIGGDLSAAGANATVAISGSPTIAGSSNPTVIAQHVHLGVNPPDFPQLNTAPLIALAAGGDVVNGATNLNNVNTLNNVTIKAGTNPTFNNDMVINGVIYIEAPNVVTFAGHATVNGLVVTQQGTSQLSGCQLTFTGHVDSFGVNALPNTPQFAAIKQQAGTFIIAPGFGVTFGGNFDEINGTIAADQLTFTGTAEGIVQGSVLGLADIPTTINGNVEISIDSKNAVANPAGFLPSFAIVPQAGSYIEVSGG